MVILNVVLKPVGGPTPACRRVAGVARNYAGKARWEYTKARWGAPVKAWTLLTPA